MRWLGLVCGGFVVLAVGSSDAAVAVSRTRFEVPSSNGHGAILVDLDDARRITQLREHVFAAEEPELDANGAEIWNGSGFAAVYTRDVLYDAYFGLRGPDGATWLPSIAADLDASGLHRHRPATRATSPGERALSRSRKSGGNLPARTIAVPARRISPHPGFS